MKQHKFSDCLKQEFLNGRFAKDKDVEYIYRCYDCQLLFFVGYDRTVLPATDDGKPMYECISNCDLALINNVLD